MSIFTWRSVKKDFGIKEILKNASFSLEDADKVGVIGTNGSGKSTVLKMLAGLEPIDSGEVQVNPNARVVYLPQQPDVDENHTVLEQVFADAGDQMALVREYEELSHQMAHADPEEMERLMARLSIVSENMDAMDAWDVETNAKIVLSKLGIEDVGARVGDLSGGYRKRVALAAALLADPDVLLMDEPTNHLDAASVEWLQEYLNQFRGALLLITHDRYFLDNVTNRIIEIDRGDLYSYSGNYSYYLEKKADQEESALSSQKKHAGILRRELAWLRQGPKARSTKQRARIDRIDDLKNKEFKQAQGKVEISTPGRRIGKTVIEVEQVSKWYGDRTLIDEFTYEFTPSDRVGIIGGNGVGKTTLLDIITQRLAPDSGTVKIGSTIHIGYFDQHSDDLQTALHDDERVIDYIKEEGEFVETADGSKITASQMLERFLFPGNQQYAPIHKLSGGEKRRLFLLRVLMSAPNVLILDEPTNDLDVQTLSILEEYLEEFNGCVITVSHDRYFLDRVVQRIFAFAGDGIIRQYPGNYSMYLDFKARQDESTNDSRSPEPRAKLNVASLPLQEETVASSPKAKQISRPRKLSFKEKRELETLETSIPGLETEKKKIECQLYGNPPSDYTEVDALSTRLAQIEQEIDAATERWMELEEIASQV